MKSHRPKISVFLTMLLALVLYVAPDSQTKSIEPTGEYVAGELLVKFAHGMKAEERIQQLGGEKLAEFAATGWQRVRLPSQLSVGEGIAKYKLAAGVERVQPNFIYHVQLTPNDPRFPDLYALRNTGQLGGTPGADIRADQAWNLTTGSRNVVVAVNDLGVDYNHQDLSANMWRNPGETGLDAMGANKATNHIDDDTNGYVDDVFGIDTINHDSDPMDDSGHGTHVAGTIGAVGNNNIGVTGVNWFVSIMAIKTHDSFGNGTSASVIEAFHYEAMMRQRGINLRISNNSWGGAPEAPAFDQALKDAIDLAGAADILNVFAAGNGDNNNDANPFYPASYDSPSIIAVAASDQSDNPAGFTSYGVTSVDLAAPGVGITSTFPGNAYRPLSGTSMATPHVSGTAALLSAFNQYLNRTQIKSLLMNNTDPLPQSWAAKPTVTRGRLNALKALQAVPTTNPIDVADAFVRQHYLDFFGREPDPGGLAYWTNEITMCGGDTQCVQRRRVDVSAAFFIEQEFQRTGSFIYRMFKGGLGRRPNFSEFISDRPQIVEGPNLEQTKQSYALAFVQRNEFTMKYSGLDSADAFVDGLIASIQQNSGVNMSSQRASLIGRYNAGSNQAQSRALAVREAIDATAFVTAEYNPSFVVMQYFGYLGRDPEMGGYLFWLDVLNNREPNNFRGMVCAFITSTEYQLRFAPVVTHSNSDCAP